jgi:hypothetical protein
LNKVNDSDVLTMRTLIASCVLFILQVQVAEAKWIRADTPHFILYSDGNQADLRDDARKLERFDQIMRAVTGIGDDEGQVRLTVYFVRSIDSVRALHKGKVKNVAGFYSATATGAYAVTPRFVDGANDNSRYADSADLILFHEYTHHLMLQYFPATYPAWYVEGFAEYAGNSRVEKNGVVNFGLPNVGRAYTLLIDAQLPIETLLSATVESLRTSKVEGLYARGWLLTHYLNNDKARKGQLQSYLRAMASGTASIEAARAAFGDLKQLDKDLTKYLEARTMASRELSGLKALPGTITVRELDPAENDTLLLQFKLSGGTLPEEREPIAAKLRALTTRYPTHPNVMTALAEAELDLNHLPAAEAAADAAIKAAPQNGRAQLWKGLAMLRALSEAKSSDEAKWKVARGWIVKANRANNEDSLPLISFYQSYVWEGKAPPEIALAGLAKAVELVPQDEGTRFIYASALAKQKKYADAITAIRPVAFNPHGGTSATYAREVITRLEQARDKGTALDAINIEEGAKDGGDDK